MLAKKNIYNTCLLIIYAIAIIVGKYYHEFWRDEIHAQLVSMHSNSIANLINNIKYEGHPPLPFFIYWLGKYFNYSLLYVNIIHGVFALASMAILLQLPKFNWLEKILLISNYFLLYEFGVFNRTYILLFFFIALQWYSIAYQKQKLVVFATALGLCFNLQCIPILLIGYLYFIYNYKSLNLKSMFTFGLLCCIAISTFYFCKQPTDSWFALKAFTIGWPSINGIKLAFGQLTKGLLFLQKNTLHFWSNSVIQLNKTLYIFSTIVLLLFFILLEKNKRFWLMALLVSYSIIYYFIHFWGIRHLSFTVLSLLFIYIINDDVKNKLRWLFIPLMLLWSYNGLLAYYLDYKNTFSNSTTLAMQLKNNKLPMCSNYGYTTEIINLNNRGLVHALDMDTTYPFFRWKNRTTKAIAQDSVLYKFAMRNDSFLYIHSLGDANSALFIPKKIVLQHTFAIEKIWSGNPSVCEDENYDVYRFIKK